MASRPRRLPLAAVAAAVDQQVGGRLASLPDRKRLPGPGGGDQQRAAAGKGMGGGIGGGQVEGLRPRAKLPGQRVPAAWLKPLADGDDRPLPTWADQGHGAARRLIAQGDVQVDAGRRQLPLRAHPDPVAAKGAEEVDLGAKPGKGAGNHPAAPCRLGEGGAGVNDLPLRRKPLDGEEPSPLDVADDRDQRLSCHLAPVPFKLGKRAGKGLVGGVVEKPEAGFLDGWVCGKRLLRRLQGDPRRLIDREPVGAG